MTLSLPRLARLGAVFGAVCLAALVATPADAGAPFTSDDGGITKNWEIDLLSSGTKTARDFGASLPAIEVDYGLTPRIQLHLVMPFAFTNTAGAPRQWGYGDTELGVKIRIIDPPEDSWMPRVAVYPLIQTPTGDSKRGLGSGHVRAFLPIWMDKELAEGWTAFGGGGFWISQLPTSRNYWYVGGGLMHDLTEKLHIGAEVFHQTGSLANRPTTGFNLGGIYDVNEVVHVLASAGRGVRNVSTTNEFTYYLALQFTF